jgi:NAD(P)H-flavin reductase
MENLHSSVSNDAKYNHDAMTPFLMRVKKFLWETEDVFTIQLEHASDERNQFIFKPGQFNMLYAFGIGESAISISAGSGDNKSLLHTIHKVGYVTSVLSQLKKGDVIGVRGPFGSGWPIKEAEGRDICIIAGGIGLPPLRPVLYHYFKNRKKYGKLTLLYGARTPQDMIFRAELEQWVKKHGIRLETTVDRADSMWRGHVGVVTTLFDYVDINSENTIAMICGPEIMMKFTIEELKKIGLPEKNIYVSMERNMKCAVGFCGHCQYGPNFVCKDGAVFNYPHIKKIFDIREL